MGRSSTLWLHHGMGSRSVEPSLRDMRLGHGYLAGGCYGHSGLGQKVTADQDVNRHHRRDSIQTFGWSNLPLAGQLPNALGCMTKHHEEIETSTWFLLVGDKILGLAAMIFLAPSVWALWLVHAGDVLLGSILLVLWTAMDGWALWQLHQRKYLRLAISVPCTLMSVAVAALGIWST